VPEPFHFRESNCNSAGHLDESHRSGLIILTITIKAPLSRKEDSMSALQKFIASARKLHAEEKDPATRWEKMTPLFQELIADPSV
jgi:hypothetical protein